MRRILFSMILAAGMLTGCATGSGHDPAEYQFLISERTPLFFSGPGQTVPDKYLEAGTRVRVVNPTADYVRVETLYGDSGWVKTGHVEKMGN
jgi:hypothetical protein